MDTQAVYKLSLTRWYVRLAVLGLLTVIAGAGVVTSISVPERSAGPVILCATLMWAWSVILKMPYEVRFDSQDLVFRAISGETHVALGEIRAIEPARSGGYVIHHQRGSVKLSPMFKGELAGIIARIQSANPGISWPR